MRLIKKFKDFSINEDFQPGQRVKLNNGIEDEFGTVTDKSEQYGENEPYYGVIKWDSDGTEEDWSGQYGTFVDMGGEIIEDEDEN